jgi:DNA-binding beta-propeller fold protein YncE
VDRRHFLAAAVTAPFALTGVPAALARGGGGTPVALVTADTEASVVAVELSTGRIYRRLATLEGPRSIEHAAPRTAIVAHTAEGAVTLVDGTHFEVRRTLRSFAEPRYTAARPDGRYAYVTDSARGEVVTLDLERARVVHRTAIGGPARHISLHPSGRGLWVALGSKAELVALVDVSNPARPRLVRHLRPPFLAHDVGFAPDGRHVWVTSGDSRTIAVYDRRTRRPLLTLPADAPPQHVTFAGGLAYVTSGDDGILRVHNARTGRLLRVTSVPTGSYNVQQGWGRILTPSLAQGTLCVLTRGGVLVERVRVAASSHDACFVMTA